ncbi:hypothetical protein OIDMADRAFT_181709 [Oidiodendron maius Zn]|uniref:Zn(2)-C6 fungal-type domain-containing protein n=1 Tax=Oidiodendron maius (strain Zn) TaxID=913774 RepID=A0A0C3CGX4_OIDMZ|nr:hypothetical protein OIDMADRAFT_181709 [Oidiodendron maius Zn]
MATSLVNTRRSKYGCWTCRLRKKKCDETQPLCFACISLELECHGYGPKPQWMDNGTFQKAQASYIKRLVSQTKLKKSRRQLLPTTQLGQGLNVPSTQAEFPYGINDSDMNHFTDPVWNTSPLNDVLTIESPYSQECYVPTPAPASPSSIDLGQNSIRSGSSEEVAMSTPRLPWVSKADTKWVDFIPQENNRAVTNEKFPSTLGESMCGTAQVAGGNIDGYIGSDSSSRPCLEMYDVCGQSSILNEEPEDALIMHYFDEVFYVQYPFYHSHERQKRGWLFSILKRSPAAYHAALALSEHHLLSMQAQNSNITTSVARLRTKDGYYNLASKEMKVIVEEARELDDCTRLNHALGGLTSILQLLFYELFTGGKRNWQALLHTAASLVPTLVDTRMRLLKPTAVGRTQKSNKAILRPEAQSSINILLGSFIWFDIISCASTGSALFLEINHLLVLATFGINMESLTGCRNPVIALILEISLLDRWKKEAQNTHKLSIIDLAKRGQQIEDRLQQELAYIDNISTTQLLSLNSAGITHMLTYTEFNKIFSLSAITYLHVVISGAYPELPEINKSVSETIAAFKRLKDLQVLRYLVWPFCVSGSLALKEQQSFFRDLAPAAGINQSAAGVCFEAFKIMEECWESREAGSNNCNWVSIMEKRGYYVLLG